MMRLVMLLATLASTASAKIICPSGTPTTSTTSTTTTTSTSHTTSTSTSSTSTSTTTSTSTSTLEPLAFFVDSTAGDDTNDGFTRATAWRTMKMVWQGIQDGAIASDATVLVRPGRYYTIDGATDGSLGTLTWRIPGVTGTTRGGTAGHPVTILVDDFYSGDVELTGAVPGNWNTLAGHTQTITSDWIAAATECTGSGAPWDCCDSAGVGCADIYYTNVDVPASTTGVGPGVCFQPGTDPGDDPIMWEILYSPDTAPVTMPTFEGGKNQCWLRIEHQNFCTAADEPYDCCTAKGVGATCLSPSGSGNRMRVYAQAAVGGNPNSLTPPVEMPVIPKVLEWGTTDTVTYITFTNNDNGRRFHFTWANQNIVSLANTHHITFEDFTMGYLSRTRGICQTGSAGSCSFTTWGPGYRSGDGFPRDTNGGAYVYVEITNAPWNFGNTLRRGTLHKGQDEILHIAVGKFATGHCGCTTGADCGTGGVCTGGACTAGAWGRVNCNTTGTGGDCASGQSCAATSCTTIADCTATGVGTAVLCAGTSPKCYYQDLTRHGSNTYEQLTIANEPWEVPNGDTSIYGYAYSWPPATYSPTWDAAFPALWSPLGPGSETPGPWIVQTDNNLFTGISVSESCGQSAFEVGTGGTISGNTGIPTSMPSGNIVENSTFDMPNRQYGSIGPNSPGPPACATSKCVLPTACSGTGMAGVLKHDLSSWDIDRPGDIWRNIYIPHCYGSCLYLPNKGTIHGTGGYTSPLIANVTVENAGPLTHTQADDYRIFINANWGTASAHGVLTNVILKEPSAPYTGTKQSVQLGPVANLDWDYNLYDASDSHLVFRYCSPTCVNYTSLGAWQTATGFDLHSVLGNPGLTSSSNFHLLGTSNAIDVGVTAPGFSTDYDGDTRPFGPAWDIGADEYQGTTTSTSTTEPGATTTSTTSTTSSTSTSTSVPTTTSTSIPSTTSTSSSTSTSTSVTSTSSTTSTSTSTTTTTSTSSTTTTLAGTVQVLTSGALTAQSTSLTNYLSPSGTSGWQATESGSSVVLAASGQLGGLRAVTATDPGGAASWDLVVMQNGSPTSLECTITAGNTTCQDANPAHTLTVTAGDTVSIRSAPSGGPASGSIRVSTLWKPTTDNDTVLTITSNPTLAASALFMVPLSGAHTGGNNAQSQGVIALSGTVKSLYTSCAAVPGGSATRIFTVYQNGVASSLTCTQTSAVSTCSDTNGAHDITVTAGDSISLGYAVTGTPATAGCGMGMVFVPTTSGQFLLGDMTMAGALPTTSTDQYEPLSLQSAAAITTEDAFVQRIGQAMTVKTMSVKVTGGALGSGSQVDFTLNVNGTPSAETCAVLHPATTCTVTADVTVSDDDLLDTLLHHSGSTGNLRQGHVGYGAVFTGSFP